jgi:hypothetical protein
MNYDTIFLKEFRKPTLNLRLDGLFIRNQSTRNQNSNASKLRAERSGFRIPVETRDFSLLQNVQAGTRAHPASCQWVLGFFPGGKTVNHSPPASAEVKNEWSYTSAPRI